MRIPSPAMARRGLALIVVIGILGVLAALAAAFLAMAQLERRASAQRVDAARAWLLARSGIEDALARLEAGQDPAYGGEDWDGNGALDGQEAQGEIHRPGSLDTASCPVRHAMRPSFFAADSLGNPLLAAVDGRRRGFSGPLGGDLGPRGNTYALKVTGPNGRLHVNGGALDAGDRDPDGPGADPADFPLNPAAAAEVAPLRPNDIPDHRDAAMEGPNGFLVRLLNNLDAVVTGGATSNLGVQVVSGRPAGGYRSLQDLLPVLGASRWARFEPYLTLSAWADPAVVRPQPMDARPQRWEDIDDLHRTGIPVSVQVAGQPPKDMTEIAGVHENPATWTWTSEGVSGVVLSLGPPLPGNGRPAEPAAGDAPWARTITATNAREGRAEYRVSWERDFVYAWSQLRLGPVALEPRAPVSLREAPAEALAAALLGLRGTFLEVWDGAAGWDGGFGWYGGQQAYDYPSEAAEETPWHRTRVDYGMTYAPAGPRRWYGPKNYDPHASPRNGGGKPVVQAAPLGRLRQTEPISADQAMAVARELRKALPGTWERFNALVDALPRWEDLDGDGKLDGEPYRVEGSGGAYTRRTYRREDLDADGIMALQHFPDGAKGLTFLQKDVLRAMANPNTDLNDFNPDANLWKEVDKTDLLDHTTELSLDDAGPVLIAAAGRVLDASGRLLAGRALGALLHRPRIRHTAQADFMRPYAGGRPIGELFTQAPGTVPPFYGLSGGQPLVGYPEPQTVTGGGRAADAAYDGQIGLGFIAPAKGPDETLRGALFDTADAVDSQDQAVFDLRGPLRTPLVTTSAYPLGSVFPDGVYSEKDRALKYPAANNVRLYVDRFAGKGGDWSLVAVLGLPELPEEFDRQKTVQPTFYIGCWAKPNWLPEASPRAHALVSLSHGAVHGRDTYITKKGEMEEWNGFDVPNGRVPLDDVQAHPVGLYFVPARNNAWEDTVGPYLHDTGSTRGGAWPRRSLIWGTTHSFSASDCLNRGGLAQAPAGAKPIGRLQGRRWQHLAMAGGPQEADSFAGAGAVNLTTALVIGRHPASLTGGVWSFGGIDASGAHLDGTPNHLRFGEAAGFSNMNYMADATFANVRAGRADTKLASPTALLAYKTFFLDAASPAALGRYHKENGAAYASPLLPAGIRPLRATWTEIPCDLWLDEDGDGWLGDPAGLYAPRNDRFSLDPLGMNVSFPVPNGRRDVHVALEIWDDLGTADPADDVRLARFEDPGAGNRIPAPRGRVFYKAVFVNEWDAATRANHPLDVTPFLDDVTIACMHRGGLATLAWEDGAEE